MKKEMICIVCPRGCAVTAELQDGKVTVTGNSCPRGEAYARAELISPTRTVTSVVKISNRKDTALSVKTLDPIPKSEIFPLMEKLRVFETAAPVAIGDVLFEACGTKIVATKSVN